MCKYHTKQKALRTINAQKTKTAQLKQTVKIRFETKAIEENHFYVYSYYSHCL